MTSNQISYWKLLEDQRANTLKEKDIGVRESELQESVRHNKAMEAINRSQVGVSYTLAVETARANKARETENLRHNMALEGLQSVAQAETARHNYRTENISQYNADISYASVRNQGGYYNAVVSENKRHNLQQEELGRSQLNVDKSRVRSQNFESITKGIRNITGVVSDFVGIPSLVGGN